MVLLRLPHVVCLFCFMVVWGGRGKQGPMLIGWGIMCMLCSGLNPLSYFLLYTLH